MKNILRFIMLAFFVGAFSLSSANAQKAKKVNMKKPDQVALAFMQRFTEFDFEGAKELTTEESHSLFQFFEMAMGMQSEEELALAKEEAKESAKNLKKANCKKTKDEASCTFCCDANNQAMDDSEIKLKKIKGKWYVHMSKDDMMDGEPIEEPVIEEGE